MLIRGVTASAETLIWRVDGWRLPARFVQGGGILAVGWLTMGGAPWPRTHFFSWHAHTQQNSALNLAKGRRQWSRRPARRRVTSVRLRVTSRTAPCSSHSNRSSRTKRGNSPPPNGHCPAGLPFGPKSSVPSKPKHSLPFKVTQLR